MSDFSIFELIVLHFLAAVTGLFLGRVISITGFLDQDVGEFVKKIWRKLHFYFRKRKGKLKMKMTRNNRSTGQMRRHMKPKQMDPDRVKR